METSLPRGVALRSTPGRIMGRRCAMCRRRGAELRLAVDPSLLRSSAEAGVEVTPRAGAWQLCSECAAAIQHEAARSGADTVRRLYIVLAVVASQRSPLTHAPIWTTRYWQDADARTLEGWMTRLILFCFLSPLIGLLAIFVLPAIFH